MAMEGRNLPIRPPHASTAETQADELVGGNMQKEACSKQDVQKS